MSQIGLFCRHFILSTRLFQKRTEEMLLNSKPFRGTFAGFTPINSWNWNSIRKLVCCLRTCRHLSAEKSVSGSAPAGEGPAAAACNTLTVPGFLGAIPRPPRRRYQHASSTESDSAATTELGAPSVAAAGGCGGGDQRRCFCGYYSEVKCLSHRSKGRFSFGSDFV